MDTLEKPYAICRGLNHHFAGGSAPFQHMTRLLEECGELAGQVNHFEAKASSATSTASRTKPSWRRKCKT